MPKHRILLSLDDDLYALLKEFSKVSGMPIATFITDLVKGSEPAIVNLIDTFKILKQNPIVALDNFQELMAKTIQQGASLQLEMLEFKKETNQKLTTIKEKKKN